MSLYSGGMGFNRGKRLSLYSDKHGGAKDKGLINCERSGSEDTSSSGQTFEK